jgi:exopolysaccharide biosynthesis WecB/TagA/CpsF family protein
VKERVTGPDFMLEICRLASTNSCKVYFLGSKESTLIKLSEKLKQKYQSLEICGIQPLPFGELSEMGTDDIIDQINRARPDVLFVGMSAPKQEFWIKKNMVKVNAFLFAGVGAAFDFYSGEIPRAPVFLRSIGLEWAHRHIVDPKRKIGRPIKTSPYYLHLIFILILINHESLLKFYMLFRVLKDDGIFRFIDFAIKQVINYEKQYIWIRKFAQERKPDSHLECKELDEDALLNLQYNKSIRNVEKFSNIAYGAQRCFGVYDGENLINFGWIYNSGCPRYDLKKKEAFIGPAITLKEFRRRDGQNHRLTYVSNLLRKEGCSKVFCATNIGNYPSINGLSSSDFRISHIQKRLLIFGKKIFSVRD